MDVDQEPDETPDGTAEERQREIREAQEAHGGSMAPSLVDETGRPVASPPPPDEA